MEKTIGETHRENRLRAQGVVLALLAAFKHGTFDATGISREVRTNVARAEAALHAVVVLLDEED